MSKCKKFKLDSSEYIELVALKDILTLEFEDRIKIYWNDSFYTKLLTGKPCIADFLDSMISALSKTIKNKFFFDPSIVRNPGISLNNLYFPEELKNYYHVSKEQDIQYNLFSNYEKSKNWLSAWLYNNENGQIILEISEVFHWPDRGDDYEYSVKDPLIAQYFQFIKNYKPIIQRVISKDIAKQWLLEFEKTQKVIIENETKNCIHCMNHVDDGSPTAHFKEIKKDS